MKGSIDNAGACKGAATISSLEQPATSDALHRSASANREGHEREESAALMAAPNESRALDSSDKQQGGSPRLTETSGGAAVSTGMKVPSTGHLGMKQDERTSTDAHSAEGKEADLATDDGYRAALTEAFSKIPLSSFPLPPGGKVLELPSDATIVAAVRFFSEHGISSAPVRDVTVPDEAEWGRRYLGMVDMAAVLLWVVQQAEVMEATAVASKATAVGMGVGALGFLSAAAVGVTGPWAVGGVAAAAVGSALLTLMMRGGRSVRGGRGAIGGRKGGVLGSSAGRTVGDGGSADRAGGGGEGDENAPAAEGEKGEGGKHGLLEGGELFKLLSEKEPFKSTKVSQITQSYRWTPFLPVQENDSMLTLLLLLSKKRLRRVPVVDLMSPKVLNLITQSAVVRGLASCRGFDWFDSLAPRPIASFGLPAVGRDQVQAVDSSSPLLTAFQRMAEGGFGGIPVVDGRERRFLGAIDTRGLQQLLLNEDQLQESRYLLARDFIKRLKASAPPTCYPDVTLGSLIEQLVEKKAHRLYVVEPEGGALLGVISLRDVISCLVSEPDRHFYDYFSDSMQ